jgi:flagellar motor switch protein FliN/FliY
MSSSLISSSSSNQGAGPLAVFAPLYDVRCPVTVVLGTGAITIGQCLELTANSVVRLQQSAGEDLTLMVNGVTLARGEVVITDDNASLRVTEITAAPPPRAVP